MGHSGRTALLWFRRDLRLTDNPALEAAIAHGGSILPVFVGSPEDDGAWKPGAASRWWLHHSLARLDRALQARGSRLILRTGPATTALEKLVAETGAEAVFWNRRYEPALIARDTTLKEQLRAKGIETGSFNSALLHEPWTIRNQAGNPFQVFTPFWKTCLTQPDPGPVHPAPETLKSPGKWPASTPLEGLGLLPRVSWDAGIQAAWTPGETGALAQLERFAANAVLEYGKERDRPDRTGTSRLSPHLHFGEVGPRQIWHAARRTAEREGLGPEVWRRWQFLAEVGWREFAHHLLFHFPHTPERPLRVAFEKFPWRRDQDLLVAWKKGRTGYPMVDAGMRELWATGWMHNRVRMIVGSFLVKNLLHSWRDGAEWFWDTLVDADLASNTLGWQWVGGCGADAAPYYRIFNPVLQGRKFDPDGAYVRRWVPELARVPNEHLHAPWEAPADILRQAGVTLGLQYPHPIVSQAASRIAALAALEKTKD
jgi:deoxyribodipyrimidine photo-lyase